MLMAYNRMLRKNLIYTAITRSQNSLIICGEKDAFFKGVETTETNLRYTSLKEQLQFKLSEEETMPTTDSEELSDRKSTRLNSSHVAISYAVFCLKKKNK